MTPPLAIPPAPLTSEAKLAAARAALTAVKLVIDSLIKAVAAAEKVLQ